MGLYAVGALCTSKLSNSWGRLDKVWCASLWSTLWKSCREVVCVVFYKYWQNCWHLTALASTIFQYLSNTTYTTVGVHLLNISGILEKGCIKHATRNILLRAPFVIVWRATPLAYWSTNWGLGAVHRPRGGGRGGGKKGQAVYQMDFF